MSINSFPYTTCYIMLCLVPTFLILPVFPEVAAAIAVDDDVVGGGGGGGGEVGLPSLSTHE